MNICEYGCGQEANYQFKNGKWCCSEKWQMCPAKKKQITKYLNSYENKENKENKKDLQKEELKEIDKPTEPNKCETCKNKECHYNISNKSKNKIESEKSDNKIHIHKTFDFTKPIENKQPNKEEDKINNEFLNTQAEVYNNVVIPKSKPIVIIKESKKQFFLTRLIKRIFKRKY